MSLETLTNENFREFVSANELAVILFYARWEHYHPILRPLLETLVEEFNGQVHVGEVDVDTFMDIASDMKIKNVPTVVYFRRGNLIESVIGVEPNRDLSGRVRRMLADAA